MTNEILPQTEELQNLEEKNCGAFNTTQKRGIENGEL